MAWLRCTTCVGHLGWLFKLNPHPRHQHCTDEAQKAETVLSAVIPTFTAPRVIHKGFVQSLTVAQLLPAFVVVCCSTRRAYWVLVGRAVFETHAACFMWTVCLADSKRRTNDIKARIEV